jgi:hypothetical protein
MKNIKKTLFLTFILFFNYTYSQVSKKVENILKPIESYESFFAIDDKIEKIEVKLFKTATLSELEYLTVNGKNPYTKAIAFKVLANKDSNRAISIFKELLNSQDSITFRTECLSVSYSLPSYFFENITQNQNLTEKESENLKKELVSVILGSENVNIKLLEELYYSIPIVPENYEKLRKLVIESKSPQLLISLAKYNNPQDIDLIKSFGQDAFLAIEEFPDNKFLPFLEENIQESKNFPFMFAVSKYCNDKSVEIVKKVIDFHINDIKGRSCKNYCLTTLYNQIYMDECKLYYPLLSDLWLSHKILSFDILDEYEKTHSEKETEEFILKGLMLDGEVELIQYNMYDPDMMFNLDPDSHFTNTSKLVSLLNRLNKFSKDSYIKALRKNLLEINALNTEEFISDLNDNKNVIENSDVLLTKMRESENAYRLLMIMNGIKILNEKSLFMKGFEILKERRTEFKEIEIWENSFQEFLKENNLKE